MVDDVTNDDKLEIMLGKVALATFIIPPISASFVEACTVAPNIKVSLELDQNVREK